MRAITPTADDRHGAYCVQCGAAPQTRDHVPPRAFLDEPFPTNLPVVGTCRPCNTGASLDEEYVACLIEVAACGTTVPEELERPRVRRALARNAALAAKLQLAFDPKVLAVVAEAHRVQRVIEKMARGLWAFELADLALGMSADVGFQPLHTLDAQTRAEFERTRPTRVFAEVGSRMMARQALVLGEATIGSTVGWQHVQPSRFRYMVEFERTEVVKLVLRGYLAAEVRFTAR